MDKKLTCFSLVILIAVAACGGGSGEASSTTSTTDGSGTTVPVAQTTTTRSDASVTLEVPDRVTAGADFNVSWTGPDNHQDYITIVPVGTAEGQYGAYFYTTAGPVGELTAPTQLGMYEVRYVDGASDTTVHVIEVEVVAFVVTLDFAAQVAAGSVFEVSWTGPDGAGDYVTLVALGAPEGAYTTYFLTANGPTGTLVAPAEAGLYEIRYIGGADDETFHSQQITVTPFEITLEAPDQVNAGSVFQVTWTGPNGPSDYVTIVASDALPGSYGDWKSTSVGSPLSLTAPETPGQYEIRYQSDRVPNLVFFSIPITVR